MWLRSNNVSCKNVSAPVNSFTGAGYIQRGGTLRYSRAGAVWCAIYLSAVFCLPSAAADEMVQESRCVKGSILLNHRLEKNMLKMISIFFIACKGETPSNISTTAQAVASLTVSKILPGNYRPLNTSIPVCLAFAFRYSKRSMLRPGKSMSMCCNCRKEMVWPSIAWRQKR